MTFKRIMATQPEISMLLEDSTTITSPCQSKRVCHSPTTTWIASIGSCQIFYLRKWTSTITLKLWEARMLRILKNTDGSSMASKSTPWITKILMATTTVSSLSQDVAILSLDPISNSWLVSQQEPHSQLMSQLLSVSKLLSS